MPENEPVSDTEIVTIEAKPAPMEGPSREVQPTYPMSRALTWLGAAVAFAGREIVPRLAASLLDAWDRRASQPAPSSSHTTRERPGSPAGAAPSRKGGRHRQRRRGR
jgi:hypothetical protein